MLARRRRASLAGRTSALALAFVASVAVGLEAAVPSIPPTAAPLSRIPDPLLDAFEPGVRAQLERARAEVANLWSGAGESVPETAVQSLGRLCQLYLHYQLADSAAPCLEEIRELGPGDFRWPYYQALLRQWNGDRPGARRDLQEVLRLQPDYVPALARAGDLALDDGDPAAAAELARSALHLAPQDAAAKLVLGRALDAQGQHREAIRWLEGALEGQPEGSLVHFHLGMAYRALGDREHAASELSLNRQAAVVSADPLLDQLAALDQSREAAFNEAVQSLRDGNNRRAIDQLTALLARFPGDADAQYNLAVARVQSGDLAQAEAPLRAALQLRPGFREASFNLAVLLGRLGRQEEAAATLDRVVTIDPDYLPARILRARLLADGGRLDAAAEELQRVLAAEPGNAQALLLLGSIALRSGDVDRARERLLDVLALAPGAVEERAQAHFQLAVLLRRAGARDDSLRHLRSALELDPDAADARAALAQELAWAGDFDGALEQYRQWLDRSPRAAAALLGRARVLLRAQRYDQAQRALEEGLARTQDDALRDLYARFLATCPDAERRDGHRALELANAVVADDPSLDHVETLAMALAELGRFEQAAQIQERVNQREQEAAGKATPSRLELLAGYRAGRPARAAWP